MAPETKTSFALWMANIIVVAFLSLLSWNANRLCVDVDKQAAEIQRLKQESVRWQIVAEDVKEMKADVKRILMKVQP